ncbi:MAG TPA: hypothetical protein VKP30_28120 [Polyangiaceae bacterium]|nr:hypothetical protein [Polyangiaceae bacterium]
MRTTSRSPYLLLSLGLLCNGCYTSRNVVTVTSLDTKYPVSASGQYLDTSGAIVSETQYSVVAPFNFEKTVTAPRHQSTETRFPLEPELDRLVNQHGGDAVTDLKIEGIDYQTGSHSSAAFWKQWGWALGLTGGTFLVVGAADADLRGAFVPTGAVVMGVGALGFLFAAMANDPTEWKFKVTGHVVKRGGASTASDVSSSQEPK